jgi:hypothetical protein
MKKEDWINKYLGQNIEVGQVADGFVAVCPSNRTEQLMFDALLEC